MMIRKNNLKLILLLAGLFALALASACQYCPLNLHGKNRLGVAEKMQGWQLLFDGKSLAGWRGLGSTGTPRPFVVEDGCIHKIASPTTGAIDLITEKNYANFELAFDWRIAPGSNSGIKYNVSEELSLANPAAKGCKYSLGFEYQVLDDDRHSDGKLPTHRCGALYDLIPPDTAKKRVNPVGEWNHSKIVYNGNHIEHWLNGELLVTAELGSPEMNAALAASKWKKMAWFGERRTGPIVIQDHQNEAWYRNLKIRELK